jgi:hypothetical protein
MVSIRRPDVPGIILALIVGVAFVFPEVGHSHAHRHQATHESGAAHTEAAKHLSDTDPVLVDHHIDAEHQHLRLTATPTAKPLPWRDPAVSTFALPGPQVRLYRTPASIFASSLPPGLLAHGPPPPSRAPPLV